MKKKPNSNLISEHDEDKKIDSLKAVNNHYDRALLKRSRRGSDLHHLIPKRPHVTHRK